MANTQAKSEFNHVKIGGTAELTESLAPEEEEDVILIGAAAIPDKPDVTKGEVTGTPAVASAPVVKEAVIADDDELPPMSITQKIVIILAAVGVIVLAGFLVYYYAFS
jgi:hypothetical protein